MQRDGDEGGEGASRLGFSLLLERGRDIRQYFKEKLEAAIADKDPYRKVLVD